MNEIQKQFVEEMYKSFGTDIVSRTDINSFTKENGYKDQGWLKTDQYKVSRGKYQLPVNGKVAVSDNLEKEIIVPTLTWVSDINSVLMINNLQKKCNITKSIFHERNK